MEAGVVGASSEVMDAMAELVEEGHDLVVLQQRRLLRCGLAEIADESGGGVAATAVGLNVAGGEVEVGSFTGQYTAM